MPGSRRRSMPKPRPYYSKYGLFSGQGDPKEDLKAKEADREIDEVLKKLRKEFKRLNKEYGDLGFTDTEVRETISGSVGNLMLGLPE